MCAAPALVGQDLRAGAWVRNQREVKHPARERPREASNAITVGVALLPVEEVNLIVINDYVSCGRESLANMKVVGCRRERELKIAGHGA
jgi:hypothetical protein